MAGRIAAADPHGLPARRIVIIPALGITQILAWGSSYYLLAVLAQPVMRDTGWPLAWIVGGLSLGLLIAGLVSPMVGRSIERRGGRPVLVLSALLLVIGLTILAIAPGLPVFLAGWVILGLGMGAGLYDAAFATLGRIYGQGARQAITTLTLFGGFASTVCWPLSALLVSEVGWRGTCLVYAVIQLLVAVPVYVMALPRANPPLRPDPRTGPGPSGQPPARMPRPARPVFVLLAIVTTMSAMISTAMSVHLFTVLQAHGIALAAAVALGALVGPSQVGARAVEMAIARYHHPIWTKIASALAVAVGLGALWSGFPVVALTLVFYGAGIGLESIARGTLPLSLFGAEGYAEMMGRLAMPSLVAQAVTPSLGAVLAARLEPDGLLGVLVILAVLNLLLVLALRRKTGT
ncbi:MAG TPA: MFS transporter [Geminicoccus sp.]|jgi:MFS family permease|uniref:MFS transporter n=1 Tax=Geminicoccus sp. TaxID=2024832 RepID=UPI002E37A947|nr:MFS transporter [Geminicoccus sp.]HEX2528645.1 MFS transporter [Geminicoccus sp.]